MEGLVILMAAVGVVVFFVVLGILVLRNLLYICGPTEVLVFSGAPREVEGRGVGYRIVKGGRSIRVPLLESVDRVDLTNMIIDVAVTNAYSKGGIPLNVQGVANVKIAGHEPVLNNAIERFIHYPRADIVQVVKDTLEGNLRGVLSQLTPEQVNEDKAAFTNKLLDEAEHDMLRMGLMLDTLKIQNVTDDKNYLNSIGRIRGASVRQQASVVEAQSQAQAAEQKADNWAKSEMAKIEADLAIARQETDKRVKDATTKREAMIQESRGAVQAQIAQVRAEIERQKARALQVERQLEADVIAPYDADRRSLEEQARGAAAKIIELGKAEAEALRRLVEEYKRAGVNAHAVLVLQQLMPLAGDIAGVGKPMKIRRLTFLPNGQGDGSTAQKVIATAEQIRAATGVDLAEIGRRMGGTSTALPPKPAAK